MKIFPPVSEMLAAAGKGVIVSLRRAPLRYGAGVTLAAATVFSLGGGRQDMPAGHATLVHEAALVHQATLVHEATRAHAADLQHAPAGSVAADDLDTCVELNRRLPTADLAVDPVEEALADACDETPLQAGQSIRSGIALARGPMPAAHNQLTADDRAIVYTPALRASQSWDPGTAPRPLKTAEK